MRSMRRSRWRRRCRWSSRRARASAAAVYSCCVARPTARTSWSTRAKPRRPRSNRKDYLNADGKPESRHALNGPLSAGIPGEPAGLVWIAKHYGKLPLSKSLAPAIRIAREGFKPDARLRRRDRRAQQDDLKRWPASARSICRTASRRRKAGSARPRSGAHARTDRRARQRRFLSRRDRARSSSTACAPPAATGRSTISPSYQVKERSRSRSTTAASASSPRRRRRRAASRSPRSSTSCPATTWRSSISAHRVHLIVEAMRRAYPRSRRISGRSGFREDAAATCC